MSRITKRFKTVLMCAAISLMSVAAAGLFGCAEPPPPAAPQPPPTFVATSEPTWSTIELRPDLAYTDAWNAVIDTLVKKFDVEVTSKEDGYARTAWLYSWTGALRQDYRVRVTIKFDSAHTKLEVKSEANFLQNGGSWVQGTDESLLQTVKTDLFGKIGRTTK